LSAPAPTVLQRILAETREDLERRKLEQPLEPAPRSADDGAMQAGRPFREALLAPGMSVIAEFKRRSPSAGALHPSPDLEEIVGAYRRGGAAAISILTEGPNFGGSLADLRTARAACDLPLLRKDFIVDGYQLEEALAAGADAVLLIVAALAPGELQSLYRAARAMGLEVLLEVHDAEELQAALLVEPEIIGINNRDLRDFSVDLGRTERLMADVPSDVTIVSESGIASAEQLCRLHERGVQAVLVGESLMRARDPSALLRRLRTFNRAHERL
jgi:indole-3-glycerol phosphate synthase